MAPGPGESAGNKKHHGAMGTWTENPGRIKVLVSKLAENSRPRRCGPRTSSGVTCELLGDVGSRVAPRLADGLWERSQRICGSLCELQARGAALGNDKQIMSLGGDQREDVIN